MNTLGGNSRGVPHCWRCGGINLRPDKLQWPRFIFLIFFFFFSFSVTAEGVRVEAHALGLHCEGEGMSRRGRVRQTAEAVSDLSGEEEMFRCQHEAANTCPGVSTTPPGSMGFMLRPPGGPGAGLRGVRICPSTAGGTCFMPFVALFLQERNRVAEGRTQRDVANTEPDQLPEKRGAG